MKKAEDKYVLTLKLHCHGGVMCDIYKHLVERAAWESEDQEGEH